MSTGLPESMAAPSEGAVASFGDVPEVLVLPPQADAPAAATINRVNTDTRPRDRFTQPS
jgi:hypothetical protein